MVRASGSGRHRVPLRASLDTQVPLHLLFFRYFPTFPEYPMHGSRDTAMLSFYMKGQADAKTLRMFEAMQSFVASPLCRRRRLLEYFGEVSTARTDTHPYALTDPPHAHAETTTQKHM